MGRRKCYRAKKPGPMMMSDSKKEIILAWFMIVLY
jgi:hypothetical protein